MGTEELANTRTFEYKPTNMLAALTTIVLSAPVTPTSYSVDAFGVTSIGSDKMQPGLVGTLSAHTTATFTYFLDTHILTTDATERLAKHLTQFADAPLNDLANFSVLYASEHYGLAMATLLHSAGVTDSAHPVPANLVHERLVKFGTPPAQIADAMSELGQLAKAATPVKLHCRIWNKNGFGVGLHELELQPYILKGSVHTADANTEFNILSKFATVGGPTIPRGSMSATCEVAR